MLSMTGYEAIAKDGMYGATLNGSASEILRADSSEYTKGNSIVASCGVGIDGIDSAILVGFVSEI